MNEEEASRYLDYLGDEAQCPLDEVRASRSQIRSLSKATFVLLLLALIGLMSGFMYYGVKQTMPEVAQTARNVSEDISSPMPSLATLVSADNSHEVWGVIISIGIYATPAMPQGTAG